jgi:pilus assembly protein Flp/PilA
MLKKRALAEAIKPLAFNHDRQGFGSAQERRMSTIGTLKCRLVSREGSMRLLTKLLRCVRAATAIEYALVASLISVAALLAFQNLGNKMDTMYNNVSNHKN